MDADPRQPDVRHGVLFPDAYVWLVLVSSLDVMFTWLVLWFGGRELNPIAAWVLMTGGLWGIVLFKFAVVVLVVLVCEYIGREAEHRRTAKTLSRLAVMISAVPPVWTLLHLITTGV